MLPVPGLTQNCKAYRCFGTIKTTVKDPLRFVLASYVNGPAVAQNSGGWGTDNLPTVKPRRSQQRRSPRCYCCIALLYTFPVTGGEAYAGGAELCIRIRGRGGDGRHDQEGRDSEGKGARCQSQDEGDNRKLGKQRCSAFEKSADEIGISGASRVS